MQEGWQQSERCSEEGGRWQTARRKPGQFRPRKEYYLVKKDGISGPTWKTLDSEERDEKHEEDVQWQEKNNGIKARKREKNSKNRIRQSGEKRTTCSEKEMCGTMHGGELHQMNHTVVVEEKSVHREERSEEQEGYGHQESERTERQERQEATPPEVGVARIRMTLFCALKS